MAEIRLHPCLPFAGLLRPGRHGAQGGAAGVALSERAGLALCVISAGANKASEVAAKMASVTGFDLPMGQKRVSKNGFALIGTAPGQWLAVAESKEARALPAMLGVALKGLATVVDQRKSVLAHALLSHGQKRVSKNGFALIGTAPGQWQIRSC